MTNKLGKRKKFEEVESQLRAYRALRSLDGINIAISITRSGLEIWVSGLHMHSVTVQLSNPNTAYKDAVQIIEDINKNGAITK